MLTAADVMTTNVISVSPETLVQDIAKLLYAHRISGLPVVDAEQRIVGIVSEGDLIRHVEAVGQPRRSWWLTLFSDDSALARDYAKIHGRTARDVMTAKVITVDGATPLVEIAMLMERHRIKRVPVLNEGKLIGIVTRSNLLQALATADVQKAVSAEDSAIRERLTEELRAQPWFRFSMTNVVVKDGTVHLFGLVRTDDERNALRVAAGNIAGVKSVEDHLKRWAPVNDL
ncbi:CBS domain-containing protein [Microvirga makkahensis]|uniref:CBS domain-containing protein n=1 Tax=Microvirga makkahensis TaxID=1128670 RepID=A0A7X3SMT6_9HYPH|nr:CBS domain-containing protein [Microvirga makkahensis]MXQ10697.1 CBS domain-containing protein [Microvirga makkahensis]